MWQMVGASLISSGIVVFLLGILGAMTWGRLMDRFDAFKDLWTSMNRCVDELFNRLRTCEQDVAVLKATTPKKEAEHD